MILILVSGRVQRALNERWTPSCCVSGYIPSGQDDYQILIGRDGFHVYNHCYQLSHFFYLQPDNHLSFTSTLHPLLPKCLHSLVSWAHHHAEDCRSCPELKEVLERQCWGSVSAVWGCVDGHSYGMDTQTTKPRANPGHTESDPLLEGEEQLRGNQHPVNTTMSQPSTAATPQTQSAVHTDATTTSADGQTAFGTAKVTLGNRTLSI